MTLLRKLWVKTSFWRALATVSGAQLGARVFQRIRVDRLTVRLESLTYNAMGKFAESLAKWVEAGP